MTGGICLSGRGTVHFAAGAAMVVPACFPGNRFQFFRAGGIGRGARRRRPDGAEVQSYNLCREKRTEGVEKTRGGGGLVAARTVFLDGLFRWPVSDFCFSLRLGSEVKM